jgi:hypothetical protein
MSSAEEYRYRTYGTTAAAFCANCTTLGPKSFAKTKAAELAKQQGWYVGMCFLCPTCRAKPEILAAVKKAGHR